MFQRDGVMLTWKQFSEQRPDLAEAGRVLIYQFGVGLAFLATTDREGAPRLHPVRPVIDEHGIYVFIEHGPKLRDLRRDGRYAMHCFPPVDNEDAVQLKGTAIERDEPALREEIEGIIRTESPQLEGAPPDREPLPLFEFLIDNCLVTRTTGHGDYNPQHTIWKA